MRLKEIKNKIEKRIREHWYNAGFKLTNHIPAPVAKARGIRILVYHGICKSDPLKFNARFLSEKQFEAHLLLLKTCYNILSFSDYKQNKIASDKLNVLLTFDDGLKNNFQYALPLLMKHKIPALFFVTTSEEPLFNDLLDVFSFLGPESILINGSAFTKIKYYIHFRYRNAKGNFLANVFHKTTAEEREKIVRQIYDYVPKEKFSHYNDYLTLMSIADLKEMCSKPGIDLASHGLTHTDLSFITGEELHREVNQSKEGLEKITGQSCSAIAFPYGSYNEETLEACRKAGYVQVFGTEKLNAPEDRKFVIERFTVNPFISAVNQMYYIAKNNYE